MPTVAIDVRGGGPGATLLVRELRRFEGLRVPIWRPWSWMLPPHAVHALGGRLPRLRGAPGVVTLTTATDEATLRAAALVLCPSQAAMAWAAGRPGARDERLRVVTLAPVPLPEATFARDGDGAHAVALADDEEQARAVRAGWARATPAIGLRVVAGPAAEPDACLVAGACLLVDLRRDVLFGGAALGALLRGVPVVTWSGGAVAEAVGDAAVLVDDVDDPSALAAAVGRALDDRDALGAAGRERASLFTWAGTAEATVMAYRELW